jgi:prolyl-tRNA synthetase
MTRLKLYAINVILKITNNIRKKFPKLNGESLQLPALLQKEGRYASEALNTSS